MPADAPPETPALIATVDRVCVFYTGAPEGGCAWQSALGHDALPLACRQFPRIALLTPCGVSLTLSNYCPTARALLDAPSARRPYPGDRFVVPFGRARVVQPGDRLTVVTWGAMVERCEAAAKASGYAVEILDLRTVAPWDHEAVTSSVKKTRRCLIVHEDLLTAGFGAEVSATLSEEAFLSLDAPIARMAIPDVPTPYNVALMNAVLPSVESIAARMASLIEY